MALNEAQRNKRNERNKKRRIPMATSARSLVLLLALALVCLMPAATTAADVLPPDAPSPTASAMPSVTPSNPPVAPVAPATPQNAGDGDEPVDAGPDDDEKDDEDDDDEDDDEKDDDEDDDDEDDEKDDDEKDDENDNQGPFTDEPTVAASSFPTTSPTPQPDTPEPSVVASELPSLEPTPEPTKEPSQEPTILRSNTPTAEPTKEPSLLPTVADSEQPSSAPTTEPTAKFDDTPVEISDTFGLILENVDGLMSQDATLAFEEYVQTFLTRLFDMMEQPIYNILIDVKKQDLVQSRRRTLLLRSGGDENERLLQQSSGPIEIIINIDGTFDPVEDQAVTRDDINLSKRARQLIDIQGDVFVEKLSAEVDDDYFSNVVKVESIAEDVVIPATSPTMPPTDNGGGSALGIGAYIGIALGGTLLLALCGGLFIQKMSRRKSNRRGGDGDFDSWGTPETTQRANSKARKREESQKKKLEAQQERASLKEQQKQEKLRAQQNRASAKEQQKQNRASAKQQAQQQQRDIRQQDSRESYSVASDMQSDLQSDMQSQMGADTLAGMDTMSYAYSLDHGIDPSVVSDPYTISSASMSASGGAVPMEIPIMGAMGTDGEVELEFDHNVPLDSNKIQRECFAPPGRLGIVIDTTIEGPVVHKVNPGSPLEGIVWPGDIIVAIDDADTRTLTASDITALMAKNMHQRRKLSIVSDA